MNLTELNESHLEIAIQSSLSLSNEKMEELKEDGNRWRNLEKAEKVFA